MLYQLKNTIVNAIRWTGNDEEVIQFLVPMGICSGVGTVLRIAHKNGYISHAHLGDWLVLDDCGDVYIYPNDVFERMYERCTTTMNVQ